jgi:hypothetical protein
VNEIGSVDDYSKPWQVRGFYIVTDGIDSVNILKKSILDKDCMKALFSLFFSLVQRLCAFLLCFALVAELRGLVYSSLERAA